MQTDEFLKIESLLDGLNDRPKYLPLIEAFDLMFELLDEYEMLLTHNGIQADWKRKLGWTK